MPAPTAPHFSWTHGGQVTALGATLHPCLYLTAGDRSFMPGVGQLTGVPGRILHGDD